MERGEHVGHNAGVAASANEVHSQAAVSESDGPAANAECPICCDDLGSGNQVVWNWPCSCHLALHLQCAVQLRLNQRAPACPQCRCAWPGIVADDQLQRACREHDVPIARNWQLGPAQTSQSEEPVLPSEPNDLVLLCCDRVLALGIPAGCRRMTWAPQQLFEPDAQGCRRFAGWVGDWVCNCCGRTFRQDDDMLRRLRDLHACGIGARCRLSIDFQQASYTWMCGCTGALPCDDVGLLQDVSEQGVGINRDLEQCVVGDSNYFAGLPPVANDESTNSFLYCPLLLHAGGLLQSDVARAWAGAIPWFDEVCQHLASHTVSLRFLSQAYAELLQVSCQHDVSMVQHFNQTGDAAAALYLNELSADQTDVDATLGLVLPGVVARDGHIPNQLQDFLLQVFGGYRLASGLDAAATHFRNSGGWQHAIPIHADQDDGHPALSPARPHMRSILNSPVLPATPLHLRPNAFASVCPAAAGPIEPARTSSEPPPISRDTSGGGSSERVLVASTLHDVSSRFGAQRRCSVCNTRIARETEYFRCSRGCRFVACNQCFRPGAAIGDTEIRARPNSGSIVPVGGATSGPAVSTADGVAPQLTHFTRFSSLSRDVYVRRLQGMIEAHDSDNIGIPNLRIEGPTSWGVWLRILESNHASSHNRGGRVRCGVLFHVAQMKLYFHGEEQATRELLLPHFESWTYTSLDACPQRQVGAEFTVPLVLSANDDSRESNSAVRSLAYASSPASARAVAQQVDATVPTSRSSSPVPRLFRLCRRTLLVHLDRMPALPAIPRSFPSPQLCLMVETVLVMVMVMVLLLLLLPLLPVPMLKFKLRRRALPL